MSSTRHGFLAREYSTRSKSPSHLCLALNFRVPDTVLQTAWALTVNEMKEAIDALILPVLLLEVLYTRRGLKDRLSAALFEHLGEVSSVVLAHAAGEVAMENDQLGEADVGEEELEGLVDGFPELVIGNSPSSYPPPKLQTGLSQCLYSHALAQSKTCEVVG